MHSTAVCVLLMTTMLGQTEAPKLDEKQLVKILEPYFQEQAEKYEFFLDAPHQQKLEIVKNPIMRWTAEGNSGAVWVWTSHGRAELVGCLGAFVNGAGKLESFHEFHSLTTKPLQRVEIGKIRVWESQKPGVEPVLLKDAPDPAATDKLRLIQMREIAREFTAQMLVGSQSQILRLTPTPLFRDNSSNPNVLDGALFSYLGDNGTDPEFILVIESLNTAGGPKWHYSPVRFTWREVWLLHNDKEVWRVSEQGEFYKSQTLRDNYVTCPLGLLDLDALRAVQKDAP